jgi:hypothetical protein
MKSTYKIAMAAGQDAGNRNMRKHGRTEWNGDDWNIAAEVMAQVMASA